ncbi:MAG: hypothetical protein JSS35_10940 [Proteobacteria bacterium]|nr:hypothetical protein [Pseudomonadota bacterium]
MRRLNVLLAGLLGGLLGPLAGVADYALIADGSPRPPSDPGAAAVFLLVLSIAGFSVAVLLAALWNEAADGH